MLIPERCPTRTKSLRASISMMVSTEEVTAPWNVAMEVKASEPTAREDTPNAEKSETTVSTFTVASALELSTVAAKRPKPASTRTRRIAVIFLDQSLSLWDSRLSQSKNKKAEKIEIKEVA